MAKRTRFVECSICGVHDIPTKPVWGAGGALVAVANTGTATTMRCDECGMPATLTCRACCPTGHGTRFPELTEEDGWTVVASAEWPKNEGGREHGNDL